MNAFVALLRREWLESRFAYLGAAAGVALLMCLGLVLLSDPLIEEAGLRTTAKLCGYTGIAGMALATVF